MKGSCIVVSEDSGPLGCDILLLGEWFLTFQRDILWHLCGPPDPFKMKALHSFETSEPLTK